MFGGFSICTPCYIGPFAERGSTQLITPTWLSYWTISSQMTHLLCYGSSLALSSTPASIKILKDYRKWGHKSLPHWTESIVTLSNMKLLLIISWCLPHIYWICPRLSLKLNVKHISFDSVWITRANVLYCFREWFEPVEYIRCYQYAKSLRKFYWLQNKDRYTFIANRLLNTQETTFGVEHLTNCCDISVFAPLSELMNIVTTNWYQG